MNTIIRVQIAQEQAQRNVPLCLLVSFCVLSLMLAELCAGGDGVAEHDQVQLLLTLLGVDSGQQHAAGLPAHHLSGGQVHDGNQGLADQLLGLVELGDAGEDLALGSSGSSGGK